MRRDPNLGQEDGVRNINLEPDRVESILEYLDRYEYATRHHVVWVFFTHTGRRPGGLYALDLEDLKLDQEDPYIEVRHRPDETELKNGDAGETEIHITNDVAQIFRDYIEHNRVDVQTHNNRRPFLTTSHGRLSTSSIRKYIYKFSRPCVVTGECPHDRDIEACEAAQSNNNASSCPSSKPPYALRHGYITSKLREGAPTKTISGRSDVSEKTLEKHYDERDEQQKRKLRQQILEELREDQGQKGGGYL